MTLLYDTNSPLQYEYVGQEDFFLKIFENYHCYVFMVFVCMCVCMCHTEHMEVRGQVCGVSSLLLPVPGSKSGTQVRSPGLHAKQFTS